MTALLAGLLGGALAGAADAIVTLGRGTLALVGGNALWILPLGIGLGGLAGGLLVLLTTSVALVLGRPDARTRERAFVLACTAVGAPIVFTDAFAMFTGTKASKVPGHLALSVVLSFMGLAAIGFVARRLARLANGGSRRALAATALGLLALAAAADVANRRVLPRLYPWFHLTMSVVFVVAVVIAVRFLLALRGRRADRRPAALVAAAALVLTAASLPALTTSQALRFAAYERTQIARLLVRGLPVRRPRFGRVDPGLATTDDSLAPLPEGPHFPNADVVLITVDALRADHVGVYGYPRATTPHIDALARRGVRFARAYTQAPHTSFSVASILTGKYFPTVTRLAPGQVHDPLPLILRNNGWKTAGFYPPAIFYIDGHTLKAYQDTNFSFEYVKFEYLDAFKRNDQIRAFFRLDEPAKAFLWLHLFEPHEPYDVRAGHDFGKGDKDDIDRYDSEIAYADAAIGELLAWLEKTRPGAIVILTADHGEEFDDHGGRYHGSTLYDEQVHVPLIIAAPGLTPRVVGAPVELLDIAPTVLGLLDLPVPARMRGDDLGPWLATPPASERRLPPAFAEIDEKRMIAWGTEKLICDLTGGFCAYYDLASDPREQKNLAEARPDRAAALRRRLDRWLDDHARFESKSEPRAIERGRLGDLSVARDLALLLRSSEPLAVRREAARLLVSLPAQPVTKDLLLAALSVDDPELRDWTVVAAARLGDEAARSRTRAIVGAAGSTNPGELRTQAALALADLDDRTGVPALGEALDDCTQAVMICRRIVVKLGELKDPRAVPALLKHLPEVQNRREMVTALGQIADPSVVEALARRLREDEYVPVRVEAARALGFIGGREARAALDRSLSHESEPAVLAAVREASSRPAPRPDRPRFPRPRATR